MSVTRYSKDGKTVTRIQPDKHWCSVALALAAGAIGVSGHDGWGWCLVLVFMIEC